ncbi:urea transporter [Streptomyces piniterrae]|uniref:Urea transporter n=2 Tax=Streptomyces piniterrae TaxID=2571125 RepID=A0A4V5MJ04_9ACTN|nr:urea transporter [Streptomyces piniterrae]
MSTNGGASTGTGVSAEAGDSAYRRLTAHYGRFAVPVLRGLAQVDFLPSALTGAVFSVALFAGGWVYGLYGLAGTAVGTATARVLGVDRNRVTAGLEGFNACLVAVGCAVFLGAGHLSTALLALAGSALVTVVGGAVARILATWELPACTLPFCLLASAMTIGAPGFARVWHHGPGPAATARPMAGPTALTVTDLWHAFFANFAQIFFMPQWYVGLIFLAGILVASRRLAAMACLGSAVALLTAWALGAPAEQVAEGTMGHNAVLVAMALGGVFLVADAWSLTYALAGAAAATALGPTLTAVFAPSGGHAFTWPFVLVALVFLAAAPAFPRLRRAGARAVGGAGAVGAAGAAAR